MTGLCGLFGGDGVPGDAGSNGGIRPYQKIQIALNSKSRLAIFFI